VQTLSKECILYKKSFKNLPNEIQRSGQDFRQAQNWQGSKEGKYGDKLEADPPCTNPFRIRFIQVDQSKNYVINTLRKMDYLLRKLLAGL
jgi:hypothetical protein